MSHRVGEIQPRHSRIRAARPRGRAGAAARQARPAGSGGSLRRRGSAARVAWDRPRIARRRAGARLSARAVRRGGPGRGAGLRYGAARPADGGRRPCGLDRTERRVVRPGTGGAGSRAGAPDRGPGAGARRPALGARGGAAQSRARRRARRGRPTDPDGEPAAAARRRGQRGERLAATAAWRQRDAERCRHALADRGGPGPGDTERGAARRRRRGGACVRPAALAGQPVALPRRPYRQLAGRLAAGGLA